MTTPYPFQEDGITHISKFHGRALVADEMGLGKSLQALVWMKRHKSISVPALVVCPASLKWNWAEEARLHINATSTILNGRTVPKRKSMVRHRNLTIINYDILPDWLPFLLLRGFQTVVLDECTYIKSPTTNRTRATIRLCENVPNVIGLTGTPLLSRPIEVWQILNILNKKEWGSRHQFGQSYCGPKRVFWRGYSSWDFNGASNKPELRSKLLENGMIRRLKANVLGDLPAKSRHIVLSHLNEKQRSEYVDATNNFLNWLGTKDRSKAASAKKALALVKIGYLKRLVAGFKTKDYIEWINRFLSENTGKLIVFGVHKDILQPLVELYQKQCVSITGKVTGEKRKIAVKQFQNDPRCRLIIGNIAAMGVGLTLTAASTVLFIELGWTPGEHLQAEDRPHRIGQKDHVQCYYLVAKNTVEEKLCRLLQEKQEVLTAVIDGGHAPDDLDIYKELIKELQRAT